MQLSDMSIKRPVVAIVASMLLVVFGLYSFFKLPVRETPNIDRPVVNVGVNYTGASAEVVESKVVKVIEDQVSGIPGITAISSFSRDGGGRINLEFSEATNIDVAANDVRDQVSRVLYRLPQDADPPVIQKADSDADPIMFVNMTGPLPPMEAADYAVLTLQPRFSSLPGVAYLFTLGARQKAMRIWLDRRAMAARNITVADVQTALRRENVELGAGQLESTDRNITMRTIRAYQTAEDFSSLVVARGPNNYLIRLGEIAKVEMAPVDIHSVYKSNGVSGVGMAIVKQPGASTLDVAKAVKHEMEVMAPTLPPGAKLIIGNDTSLFISAAIHEVSVAVIVSGFLVMLVIYLFLGFLVIVSFGLLWPLLFLVPSILVALLYHALQTHGEAGGTLGMRLFGLEAWSVTKGRPTLLQTLVHTALLYGSFAFTGGLILVVALFNRERRTLHDFLSGEIILRINEQD